MAPPSSGQFRFAPVRSVLNRAFSPSRQGEGDRKREESGEKAEQTTLRSDLGTQSLAYTERVLQEERGNRRRAGADKVCLLHARGHRELSVPTGGSPRVGG